MSEHVISAIHRLYRRRTEGLTSTYNDGMIIPDENDETDPSDELDVISNADDDDYNPS